MTSHCDHLFLSVKRTNMVPFFQLMTEDSDCCISSDVNCAVNLETNHVAIHVYRLVSGDEADPTYETIEVSSDVIKGGTRWLLPSTEFDGLWDSLVYDSSVKRDLINYSESALLFSDYNVSSVSYLCLPHCLSRV